MSTSDPTQAGLPDVAALTALANQFFSALPGGAPSTPVPGGFGGFNGAGAAAPSMPGVAALPALASPISPAPSTPTATPANTPFVSTAPSVPPAFTGDLPLSPAPTQASTPTSAASWASGGGMPTPGVATSGITVPDMTLNPSDWGLPTDAELASVLALRSPSRVNPGLGQSLATPSPSFYFLEQAPLNAPGIAVPGGQQAPVLGQAPNFKPPFDVNLVRRDFPILRERVNGRPLIWLDNAATTQKPQSVIDRISYFYEHENSNIHRAAHELAARATDAYEGARETTRKFLNARSSNEIVFVRGTTEAINLVAKSWGRANIGQGDEIIVSHLEHHANIVPWQQLCAFTGAKLRVIPVDDDGQVLLDEYAKLLGPRTKLVSFTQVSNALGTVTPAKQMVAMAHSAGARVLVDGAQSVSHMRSDVIDLDCDWFVFSGHKIFGPTGIGALYGKEALLNETPPWQGGGNMIKDVTFEHTEYHDAPGRFEAGTGNIADAVGMGAALAYVMTLGIDAIGAYEHELLVYATRLLKDVPGLRLIGTAAHKASVMSFTLQGYKTEEVGAALNKEGIAVRSGHHCAQPILRRFGLEATVRPSLAFYNTTEEVDTLVNTLHRLSSSHKRV